MEGEDKGGWTLIVGREAEVKREEGGEKGDFLNLLVTIK